jgi:hypothetical protein
VQVEDLVTPLSPRLRLVTPLSPRLRLVTPLSPRLRLVTPLPPSIRLLHDDKHDPAALTPASVADVGYTYGKASVARANTSTR